MQGSVLAIVGMEMTKKVSLHEGADEGGRGQQAL